MQTARGGRLNVKERIKYGSPTSGFSDVNIATTCPNIQLYSK